ncbi:MAG: DegV family protein [Defluviitaleaceae bacterium]|nr:DegV family protein [Defluviitaleaceae bacterium]
MFKIISDSSCDFTEQMVTKHDITIVPFYVTFDGTNYLKEGVEITKDEYFYRLTTEKNTFPKTSQPNPQDYITACTPHLEQGFDLLVLTISSRLSQSNNSANVAAKQLQETYPKQKIAVVDSLSVTCGQALILYEMVRMRDMGLEVEAVADFTKKLHEQGKLYFTLDTLEYLQRGGRIGKASALLGGLLNLKPVMNIANGEVTPVAKVRGKSKAKGDIIDRVEAEVAGKTEDLSFMMVHIESKEEAEQWEKEIKQRLGITLEFPPLRAGTTIGTHTGPGGIGLAYVKKYKG